MAAAIYPPRRLCCVGFSPADRAALGCLVGLLTPYLRSAWEMVELPMQADLCLMRLDGEVAPSPSPSHPRVVGCAQHPRQFGTGTLHRPLRAPQLLALLSEIGTELTVSPGSASPREPMPMQPVLRLLAWPLDVEQGPRLRVHVLAALSAGPCTMQALAARIGADGEIGAIVEALCSEGLLATDKGVEGAVPVTPSELPGWRGFMAGLGRRLGISST